MMKCPWITSSWHAGPIYTLPNVSQLESEFQVEYQTQLGIQIWMQIQIGIPSWIVDHSGECTCMQYILHCLSLAHGLIKITSCLRFTVIKTMPCKNVNHTHFCIHTHLFQHDYSLQQVRLKSLVQCIERLGIRRGEFWILVVPKTCNDVLGTA